MALYNIDKNTSPTQSYYNSIASPVVNNTTGMVNPGMAKGTATATNPVSYSGRSMYDAYVNGVNAQARSSGGGDGGYQAPTNMSWEQWQAMSPGDQIKAMQGYQGYVDPKVMNGFGNMILDSNDDLVKQFTDKFGTKTFDPSELNNQALSGYEVGYGDPKLYNMGANDFMQDPSRILRLPDGRYVMETGNRKGQAIAQGQSQDAQSGLGAHPGLLMGGLVLGGGLLANLAATGSLAGAAAADVAVPANLPAITPTTVGSLGPAAELAGAGTAATTAAGAGTNLGSYAGMSTGLDGAAGSTLSVGSPVAGATGVNAAIGTAAQATGGLTIGDILRGGGNLASIFGQQRNNAAYQNAINNAANRADPFGQYRSEAGQNLMALIRDPSLVTKVPGYEFRRTQGEQGINRNDSMGGYGRSGNRLYDISKFNSDYASSEYDKEFNRLARMAGVDVNPATAGTIAAGGAAQGYNNNQSTLGAWLSGAARFSDWLDGGGAGRAASSFASAGDTLSGLFG